jgi:hypothetical protein
MDASRVRVAARRDDDAMIQRSRSSGDAVTFANRSPPCHGPAVFHAATIAAAIGEGRRKVPVCSYSGFSEKVMTVGGASYLVLLSGRCAVYLGRSGETHVERMSA